ncbi:MAG: alpha/beta hydrolase family protein [Alphaproteobacteria bacterium]
MKKRILSSMVLIFSLIFPLVTANLFAQSHPEFVQFPARAMGALYKPDSGPAPHVGVIVMHRTSNFMTHPACTNLSSRGFMVLCMNTRFDNNESDVIFEELALDVKAGVNYLKNTQHMSKVILLAHSGGGPTMSFYQAVAEVGPSFCTDPNKLTQCDNSNGAYTGLPRADGIVFVDAHPGVGTIGMLRSNNPAVVNEARPNLLRPDLDPFNPANGYNPNGPSTYSDRFKQKYFAAQSERMNDWIAKAQEIRDEIGANAYIYTDDGPVVIGASTSAKLFNLDLSILCCTLQPHKLLQNDGSIVTEVIHSVRTAHPENKDQNATFDGGGRLLTVHSFLSANAIRSTNSIDGIDYCSSNNSTPCNVQQISVPVLFTAMGGYYFIRDNEIHYDLAKSVDKDFVVAAGLLHGITPCTNCTGGPYTNVPGHYWDYVSKWINDRF